MKETDKKMRTILAPDPVPQNYEHHGYHQTSMPKLLTIKTEHSLVNSAMDFLQTAYCY